MASTTVWLASLMLGAMIAVILVADPCRPADRMAVATVGVSPHVQQLAAAALLTAHAPGLFERMVVAHAACRELAVPRRVSFVRHSITRDPYKYDEGVQQRRLERRLRSGHASVRDLRMLRAICSNSGNHQCRNQATRMLQYASVRARRVNPRSG